jgi:hypothetical protein
VKATRTLRNTQNILWHNLEDRDVSQPRVQRHISTLQTSTCLSLAHINVPQNREQRSGQGFSVGDLIAVGKLAHDIAIALSDCRGASADFRSLVELLGSLKTSLDLISNFISTLPVRASSRVDPAFMNGILFHAGRCYKLLNEFAVCNPYTEVGSIYR